MGTHCECESGGESAIALEAKCKKDNDRWGGGLTDQLVRSARPALAPFPLPCSLVCSGRGICKCGVCECFPRAVGQGMDKRGSVGVFCRTRRKLCRANSASATTSTVPDTTDFCAGDTANACAGLVNANLVGLGGEGDGMNPAEFRVHGAGLRMSDQPGDMCCAQRQSVRGPRRVHLRKVPLLHGRGRGPILRTLL